MKKALRGMMGCGIVMMVTAFAAGCATAPPPVLVDARAACAEARAVRDPDPRALHEAERALSDAEFAFEENGDGPETRMAANIAQRRAMAAKAKAKGSPRVVAVAP